MPRHYYNINLRDFFVCCFVTLLVFFSCFLFFFGILCFECFFVKRYKMYFFIVSIVLQISAIELNGSLSFFLHSREQLNHTTCVLQSFFAHARTHVFHKISASVVKSLLPQTNQTDDYKVTGCFDCFLLSRAAGKTWSRRPCRTDRQRSSPGTAGTSVPDQTRCRRTARRRCGCTRAEPAS